MNPLLQTGCEAIDNDAEHLKKMSESGRNYFLTGLRAEVTEHVVPDVDDLEHNLETYLAAAIKL